MTKDNCNFSVQTNFASHSTVHEYQRIAVFARFHPRSQIFPFYAMGQLFWTNLYHKLITAM